MIKISGLIIVVCGGLPVEGSLSVTPSGEEFDPRALLKEFDLRDLFIPKQSNPKEGCEIFIPW